MPSPSRGMDLYLEGPSWPSFHVLLIAEMLNTLAPRIRPHVAVPLEPTRRVTDREEAGAVGVAEPVTLTLPMPSIPILLEPEDPDVVLDLQAAFRSVYDRAGYDYSLDYEGEVELPLSEADAQWAKGLLANWNGARQ